VTTRGSAVVVGGGVAGLTWALDAMESGLDVTVLERSTLLGGAVRSAQLGPVTVDVGAESFALARTDVLELASRLDLAQQVERPAIGQAHVMLDGRCMPLPPGLLGIPATLADIAALLGPDAAAQAETRDGAPIPEVAPPTIGRLVRDRLGDRVAELLVDPVLAGVHATRADDAELASVAPSLYAAMRTHGGLLPAVVALRGALGPAGAPVATIAGGMSRLVARLVERLEDGGAVVRTGTSVERLHHEDERGRWRVHTDAGEVAADVLCLAVPARAAAALLHTLSDPAAREIAEELARLQTTDDVTLVTLLIEDAELAAAGAPVGSGVLVADTSVRAKAMTHASAKWGWLADALPADHHVVRLSYGGIHRTEERDEATLVADARDDVIRLLRGATSDPTIRASLVTRWPGALIRPVVGRAERLAAIDAFLPGLRRVALVGSAVAGNGLAGVVGRSAHEARRTLP
jgi:oxygen-dependent protoporphyrinogen oxidase